MLRPYGAGKKTNGSSLKLSTALLTLAAGIAMPGQALGQIVPRPQAPTREEVTRPDLRPTQPQQSQLEVEGGIERAPCALDNPEYSDDPLHA